MSEQNDKIVRTSQGQVAPRNEDPLGFNFFDRFIDPTFMDHLSLMRHHMNAAFTEPRVGGSWSLFRPATQDASSFWRPNVDVKETNEKITVSAELPGIAKENVAMQIVDNRLVISGEKKETISEDSGSNDTGHIHRIERSYGKFERSFTLPKNAIIEQITAKMDDGVLKVEVPKKPEQTPSSRFIEIQ